MGSTVRRSRARRPGRSESDPVTPSLASSERRSRWSSFQASMSCCGNRTTPVARWDRPSTTSASTSGISPAPAAKWKAAGLKWEPAKNPHDGQGFLTGPDSVRIEIYENKTIPTPMQMHHIHLMVPSRREAQQAVRADLRRDRRQAGAGRHGERAGHRDHAGQKSTSRRRRRRAARWTTWDSSWATSTRSSRSSRRRASRSTPRSAPAPTHPTPDVDVTDRWGTEIEITQGLATTPVAH